MELLIVEDDPLIGKALQKGFLETGHECVWARDGLRGLDLARAKHFDAITLDLMLPGVPGLEVLKQLRREESDAGRPAHRPRRRRRTCGRTHGWRRRLPGQAVRFSGINGPHRGRLPAHGQPAVGHDRSRRSEARSDDPPRHSRAQPSSS